MRQNFHFWSFFDISKIYTKVDTCTLKMEANISSGNLLHISGLKGILLVGTVMIHLLHMSFDVLQRSKEKFRIFYHTQFQGPFNLSWIVLYLPQNFLRTPC